MGALTIAAGSLPVRHAVPGGRPRRHLVSVPTGAQVADARPTSAGLRITRRGRLALTTLVASGAVAAGAGQAVAGAGDAALPSVTVAPGQTLGTIAARELPGVPVDEAVVAIQSANGLSTTHVHTGQELLIPAR